MTSKARASFFKKMFKPSGAKTISGLKDVTIGMGRVARGGASLFRSQPTAAKMLEAGTLTYLGAEYLRKKQNEKQQQMYMNPYQL